MKYNRGWVRYLLLYEEEERNVRIRPAIRAYRALAGYVWHNMNYDVAIEPKSWLQSRRGRWRAL